MSKSSHGWTSALLGVVVLLHLALAPFTKVEESFNVQATHDLMFHKLDIDSYDHKEFPGVVPRTFLGAIFVSVLSFPAAKIAIDYFGLTKMVGLYVARACLGLISVWSFSHIASATERHLGPIVSNTFLILTMLQFHLPFYMSRFLPNTFALILCNIAIGFWVVRDRPETVVALLVASSVCFRCDTVLLLICISIHLVASDQLSLGSLIKVGILSGIACLSITVLIDSWFWGRWVWPEGEVFYFNTILNKSKEWGVMPFSWYWTSALPRGLLTAYPLALSGAFTERRVRSVILVALAYVLLYSNLGHKEVRFLFPVLPLFNIAASTAFTRILINRKKSMRKFITCCLSMLSIAIMAGASGAMLWASIHNYPGGTALQRLHEIEGYSNVFVEPPMKNGSAPFVHIDTFPAMTGVTRFGELGHPWRYSKAEGLTLPRMKSFTHLLSVQERVPGFVRVGDVEGFAGFKFRRNRKNIMESVMVGEVPIEVLKSNQVFIFKRHK
ncbi:hypothetical protein BSKO_08655 [Bryopsis sp. KO-2023]|nr:hypothetical protein BSKO_08655 [Bryopsis sp. KO-2023]